VPSPGDQLEARRSLRGDESDRPLQRTPERLPGLPEH
jgi:hypothetical protein